MYRDEKGKGSQSGERFRSSVFKGVGHPCTLHKLQAVQSKVFGPICGPVYCNIDTIALMWVWQRNIYVVSCSRENKAGNCSVIDGRMGSPFCSWRQRHCYADWRNVAWISESSRWTSWTLTSHSLLATASSWAASLGCFSTQSLNKHIHIAIHWNTHISIVCSTKVLCPQNLFSRKSQRYKSCIPITWTYDICAFDTGTYYDYYWQNQDILQWCKQNKHFRRNTGNKYSTLCPQKCPPFYFCNNSVKNKSISIIFGTQTPEETWHWLNTNSLTSP